MAGGAPPAAKRSRRSSTTQPAVPATPAAAALAGAAGTPGNNAAPPSTVRPDAASQVAKVLAQHLGRQLSQSDLLNARLVCTDWKRALPQERTHVCIPLRPYATTPGTSAHAPSALEAVPSIFPSLDSIAFRVSERLLPSLVLTSTTIMASTPWYATRVRHLSFATTSPAGSKSSSWPAGMPFWPINLSQLTGLQSLTFAGRAPTTELLAAVAATHTQLTSLVVAVALQQDGLSPCSSSSSAPPSAELAGRCGLRASSVGAISLLRGLRRLEVQLADMDWAGGEVHAAQLRSLSALTELTELRLNGAAISVDTAHVLLRSLRGLRRVSLSLAPEAAGRPHNRRDLALWKRLESAELRLQGPRRPLEADVRVLGLGLAPGCLRALHLRSCIVTPYALSTLSSLVALRELSFDAWAVATPALPLPPQQDPGGGGGGGGGPRAAAAAAAASAVRCALVGLLGGPMGRRLEVLRMDVSGGGRDVYEELPSMAAAWARLRVLHLAGAAAFRLAASGALAALAGLGELRELRVAVQGPACRDGSCLRAAWLPPGLTCLELAGVHLTCPQQEEEEEGPEGGQREKEVEKQQGLRAGPAGCAVACGTGGRGSGSRRKAGPSTALAVAVAGPAAASGGDGGIGDCGGGGGGRGHLRLRQLRRLSLHGCRFGCCDHLQAALGPAALPHLTSLELHDVAGLTEGQLAGLEGLRGLTELAVCALSNPSITSSGMAHASGLTRLTRLKWHAGDSLDMAPDPAVLKGLRQLGVLDVSVGQWWRLSRWHATSVLTEVNPRCEVAAS